MASWMSWVTCSGVSITRRLFAERFEFMVQKTAKIYHPTRASTTYKPWIYPWNEFHIIMVLKS
jgi:hypothetical protein